MVEALQTGGDAVVGGWATPPRLIQPWMAKCNGHGPNDSNEVDWLDAPKSLIGLNMGFRRGVLTRVPRFDDELGPGAMGFGDDSLFGWQLNTAGFRIVALPGVKVEHHFDVTRLSRASLLKRACASGASEAYVAYHWRQESMSLVWLRKIRWMMRLSVLRVRLACGDGFSSEGCTQAEFDYLKRLAFIRQMDRESRRPRLYTQRGLIKLA